MQLTRSLANSISDAFFLCTAASLASQAFLTNSSLLTSELSRSFLRVWHWSSAAESSTFKTESWKERRKKCKRQIYCCQYCFWGDINNGLRMASRRTRPIKTLRPPHPFLRLCFRLPVSFSKDIFEKC